VNFFFQPDIRNGVLELDQEESIHCIRVLRNKKNDLIQVLDGKGGYFVCKITEANPRRTRFEISEERPKIIRDHSIHIAIAPTKNMDRLEWFIEKSIEIGIDRISFLLCQHSERKKINLERIHKKSVSALKQSGNLFLPEINDIFLFESFIFSAPETYQKFIAYAGSGNSQPLIKIAPEKGDYLILIGPEGDFSADELQASLKAGFIPVSLGSSRLRTETAAIVACTVLNLIHS
jgi:16S rRNA (uracil1498-N3)-methyltransferase